MKKYIILLLLLIIPLASAAVNINEVMFNPAGTDTGREWIELYNDGDEPLILTGWTFYEEGSNHKLTAVQGDLAIPAKGYAVLADNPIKFKVDYPSYQGVLIDSAFSLKNTGEELALKDANKSIVVTTTYPTSAAEGNTVCSDFSECVPTPGETNEEYSAPPEPEKEIEEEEEGEVTGNILEEDESTDSTPTLNDTEDVEEEAIVDTEDTESVKESSSPDTESDGGKVTGKTVYTSPQKKSLTIPLLLLLAGILIVIVAIQFQIMRKRDGRKGDQGEGEAGMDSS